MVASLFAASKTNPPTNHKKHHITLPFYKMKKLFLFSFLLFTSSFLLLAQAPQGIPYQAIARNASGAAIANTAVKVRFSIRDSIATGAIKYQETHNPTTSALGLFSVNVGMGTVVSGTFSGINWGKNAKFLQVEMDPAGGTTFTDLGTTQMMSVPYALQASNSSNGGLTNLEVFNQPGTFLWTAPANIKKVKVECWGGGAGGLSGNPFSFDQQGPSGGYGMGLYEVEPGRIYSIIVGAGGFNFVSQGSPTLEQISVAFGGSSSFGNMISTGGGSWFIPAGGSISFIRPKGGTSNGMFSISGNIGTIEFGGGTYPSAGSAPMGGGGGHCSYTGNGIEPGGGSMAFSPTASVKGGNGRVVIWY